ncbi:Canalicular multispecific organic anion transporter 2, partial [Podila verticillata]
AFPRSSTQVQIRAREKKHLSDFELANVFSRMTFHYVHNIITLGASRPLKATDVESTMLPDLHTNANYDRVAASWEKSKAKAAHSGKTPTYFFALLRAYRGKTAVGMLYRLAGFGIFFVPTMLFSSLLQFIRDYSDAVHGGTGKTPPPIQSGLLIATAMFLANLTASLLITNAFQMGSEVGLQARSATVALIYAKALKLSPAARQKSTLGEITNHMAVDAETLIRAADFLPFLITVPFELLICLYLLYQQLGWSICAGVAVFAILTPIQAKMAVLLNRHRENRLGFMDSRVRLLTEILSNIKIVKLYGWEDAFRKKVEAIRVSELGALKSLTTIRSILTIVYSSVTLVMALFTFSVFAIVGGPNMTPGKITPEVIFVSITLFGMMSKPLGMITYMFSQTISVMVGCRRIQGFLLMEEIDSSVVQRYSRQVPSGNSPTVAVEIENGTFAWEKQVEAKSVTDTDDENQPLLSRATSPTVYRPTLNNINIRITDGSLTAVVGRIGQGKSSLLGAIMGEMYKLQGFVKVYGDIAYVPQQAWIINATLKDNILFGKPFDQEKYDRIVFASGLVPDFAMLPAGDQTEIGERGINLSGGQKQRVSLARAAYQDADVYLLDDPLSAVDAHVDQHLWNNLVGPNGLLSNKTRILITHGIHHLEHVDQILVFKEGSISEAGHYDELMAANGAFHQLIKEYSVGQKKKKAHHDKDKTKAGESDSEDDSSRNTIVATKEEANKKTDDDEDNETNGELVSDEKMVAGKVSWKILMVYARAVSLPKAVICIGMFIIGQVAHISTNLWLRKWINDTEENERTGGTLHPVSYYLLGYGGLVLVFMFFDVVINYVSEVVCGIQGSKVLFNRLLNRVFRLPMSFFDTTPMGRIINRFSSDMDSIDEQLPEEFNDLFAFMSIIGGALVLIAYSTPAFLVMIPPLGVLYFFIQDYFIKCSASLKRLYSVSKSPLYQHFSESLAGVSTIRVMRGLQAQFLAKNQSRADTVANRMYVYSLANRWLQVRIELLGSLIVFLSAALSVLKAGELDPTLVAVALSYSITMQGFINYLIRTVNEVQNILVSVERVHEYSEKPMEAPAATG